MKSLYKYKWRDDGEARYMKQAFGIDYCVAWEGKDFNGFTLPCTLYVTSDPIVFEARDGDAVRFREKWVAVKRGRRFFIPNPKPDLSDFAKELEPPHEIVMRDGKPFIMPEEVK